MTCKRIGPDGEIVDQSDKAEKAARQRFSLLMDNGIKHVKVTQTGVISVVGNVNQMHGPDGCCTCCVRRETA